MPPSVERLVWVNKTAGFISQISVGLSGSRRLAPVLTLMRSTPLLMFADTKKAPSSEKSTAIS
jgi:hypothetical protein